ncbi:MAG: hypothetical protein LBC73_01830 [Oscillospiraceae bacterium]|jgi:hypothetical protein|nr:hypothetical protein [Oscillospiraceae bacterium]
MKYFKIIVIYSVGVATIIGLFSELFKDTWFYAISEYLMIVVMFAMLFHIGKVMENELIKKKYYIYISIIASEIVFFQILSAILYDNSTNTWLSLIALNVVFVTAVIMLFDIARIINKTKENVGCILYAIALVGIVVMVINSIMTLVMEI